MAGTWPGRKARKLTERPYAVFDDGVFRTEVLKINAGPTKAGPYRTVFARVISPMTSERGDLGDTYVSGITGALVDFDSDVFPTAAETLRAVFGG